MFDMPELVGTNSVIVPASGSTRRQILLKPEHCNAVLSLLDAPAGVWLEKHMLIVSSDVSESRVMKVCAYDGEEEAVLNVEICKDPSLQDAPPAPLQKEGWKLFYHEEFDGAELDPEFWSPYYLRGWTTDEKALADYSFRDGCLSIACSAGRGPWCSQDAGHRVSSIQSFERKHLHRFGSVTGARDIMDFDGFATQYGYFEIRARFPDTGDGSHFAWWMLGVQDDQNGFETVNDEQYPIGEYSDQTAEFDIIEQTLDRCSKDFDMNFWRPVIHPNGSRALQYLWVPGTQIKHSAASEFHRYGFEWDETGTKFYLDGELVQETDRTPPYRMMTLFSVYGGSRDEAIGLGPDRGIYPKEVLIDYFRVYKRDEAPKVTNLTIHSENSGKCLKIPASGKSVSAMTAQVLDQFDKPMPGERVTWHLSKDISGAEFLSEADMAQLHLSIDRETGVITVDENAAEGTEVFVSAVHENGRKAVKHLRLSKAEPEVTVLRFAEPRLTLNPAGRKCLSASLLDQYGSVMNREVRYQISKDLTGRQQYTDGQIYLADKNTVAASENAQPGSKFVVTAHCADLVCSCIVKIVP